MISMFSQGSTQTSAYPAVPFAEPRLGAPARLQGCIFASRGHAQVEAYTSSYRLLSPSRVRQAVPNSCFTLELPHVEGSSPCGSNSNIKIRLQGMRATLCSLASADIGGGRPKRVDAMRAFAKVEDQGQRPSFIELTEGPYFITALMLDAPSSCMIDATCRALCALNRAAIGPWRALGAKALKGLELKQHGLFEQPLDSNRDGCVMSAREVACINWKDRFLRYSAEVLTFCAPFGGSIITSVAHPLYFRCRLCTDMLDDGCENGVYLEVRVDTNPDNVSIGVVDSEAGGGVGFGPDTGEVIRERKAQGTPGKVECTCTQSLPTLPPGSRFHGIMGLYLFSGGLAFFRRCTSSLAEGGSQKMRPWETTGFVSDLTWAEGRLLTPSLAFRSEGEYSVKIVKVGKQPPLPVGRPSVEMLNNVRWSLIGTILLGGEDMRRQ